MIDPARPETDPARPETDPARPETDPARPETDPARPDSSRPDTPRQDPARPDPARSASPAPAEPARAPAEQPTPPPENKPTRPPRIAVVIPCYNDGILLPEAVSSAAGAGGVELVVVDDGSTDPGTRRVLADLAAQGVSVLRQDNAGLSAARMAGVGATSAPYVYNLDADDLAAAEALGEMADRLDADPEAAVCYGDYREFGDSELTRLVPHTIDPFRVAYTNEYPVTALFRRSALEAAGGWRHLGAGYEDWGLWMTLAEGGCRGVHAGAGVLTFHKRLHGQRMLGTAKADHRELYRALRREHPRLFADLAAHRRRSSLSPSRKLLYPVIYGGRRRYRFEGKVKAWLDRTGIWTLRG
jgi:glycosyltransferase involved in cell wall biosynthesis